MEAPNKKMLFEHLLLHRHIYTNGLNTGSTTLIGNIFPSCLYKLIFFLRRDKSYRRCMHNICRSIRFVGSKNKCAYKIYLNYTKCSISIVTND